MVVSAPASPARPTPRGALLPRATSRGSARLVRSPTIRVRPARPASTERRRRRAARRARPTMPPWTRPPLTFSDVRDAHVRALVNGALVEVSQSSLTRLRGRRRPSPAPATGDRVRFAVTRVDRVVAGAARIAVAAGLAVEVVGAGVAADGVVPVATQRVFAVAARHRVVALAPVERVIALAARRRSASPAERVVAS